MNREQEQLVIDNLRLVHYVLRNTFKIDKSNLDYDDLVSIGYWGLIKSSLSFDKTKGIKFSTYAARCISNEIRIHFRKTKQYKLAMSINTILSKDDKDKELTLEDILEDSKSNFVDTMENNETLIQTLDIILNCLDYYEKLVILYSVAGFVQNDIAKILGYSQSYVSRLQKKAIKKIHSLMGINLVFKRTFYINDVDKNTYEITFSTKYIKNFDDNFIKFLSNLKQHSIGFNFKIDKEIVRLQILKISESFLPLVKVIQEIQNIKS